MYLTKQKGDESELADISEDRLHCAHYVKSMRLKFNTVDVISYHASVKISLYCAENYMRLLLKLNTLYLHLYSRQGLPR